MGIYKGWELVYDLIFTSEYQDINKKGNKQKSCKKKREESW